MANVSLNKTTVPLITVRRAWVRTDRDGNMAVHWSYNVVHPGGRKQVIPSRASVLVANRKVADRMISALHHGAPIITDMELRKDRDGKTYVEATHHFLGRTLNADLRALGY